MNSRSRSKTHRKTRAVLLPAAVFLVFLLLVEAFLAMTHWFGARKSWTNPDSLIGWRYKANAAYWYNDENDHPITGRINNHGWRDRTRTHEKPAGTYRIAILGDSFVEAFQVELDSTFAAITERELNAAFGYPVEVMNFGRSGMTQSEQFLMLESDVFRFDPDVVVLLFVPVNDIDDVNPATADDLLRPFYYTTDTGDLVVDTRFAERQLYLLKRLINPFKQHSALISLGMERYNMLRASQRRGAIRPAPAASAIRGALSLCTATPAPVHVDNYRLNKRLIGEIAKACARKGPRFVLACTDWKYQQEDIERRRSVDPTFDPRFFERDLAELADSLNADYVGLQEIFERHYEHNRRPLHWQHWNYEGHRVAAAAMVDKLGTLMGAE